MLVVTIAPGHWLDAPAAASYARCRAAGMPAGINDAGRTRAEQQALYAAYLRGELEATAAPPGKSKHETGLALDLPAGPRAWLVAHPEHGWRRPLANEPWHFEYHARLDRKRPRATLTERISIMGAANKILAELEAIRTKLNRQDRQFIVFKIQGDPADRWCVARADHTWAIAPSETAYRSWRRYVLPQFLAGDGQDAMAVWEWPAVYVIDPAAFGVQVAWQNFQADW